MSNQNIICQDIFSNMGNLLRNFNANIGQASGFSQGEGFIGQGTEGSLGGNIESMLNDNSSVIMIGLLTMMYVAFSVLSSSYNDPARQNMKGRNQNNEQDRHNGDGDVY